MADTSSFIKIPDNIATTHTARGHKAIEMKLK